MHPRLLPIVDRVFNGDWTKFGFRATFVTPAGKYSTGIVQSLVISHAFVSEFTAHRTTRIMMNMADYRKYIFPYRNELRVIFTYMPVDLSSDSYQQPDANDIKVYRAFLYDNDDHGTSGGNNGRPQMSDKSTDEQIEVAFQLVELPSERLAYKYGGGIIRYTNAENAIKAFLNAQLTADNNGDDLTAIRNVDVAPPDNLELIPDLVIPHNTRLIDLPEFIHDQEVGVYKEGIASYVMDDTWYIWPPYQTDKWDTTLERITLIQMTADKVMADRTFMLDGNRRFIVCTGDAKLQDLSVATSLQGNGVRFMKAEQAWAQTDTEEDNREVYQRDQVTAEFTTSERSDGETIANFSDNMITDNILREYSKMQFRNGALFATVWQRSDIRFLRPGMPARIMYERDGHVYTYEGRLIQATEYNEKETQGAMTKHFLPTCGLIFFINKEPVSVI